MQKKRKRKKPKTLFSFLAEILSLV
uniref:Uncharacterized protein n=1 Tax=Arundo donax TaxID=35708 RepID=A0A0A9ARQ9_ARUDO